MNIQAKGLVRRITSCGVAGALLLAFGGSAAMAEVVPSPTPLAQVMARPLYLKGASAQNAVSLDTSLDVHVYLTPNPGLSAYAQAVSTPGSPLYHQYLTPAQIAANFGPSPATGRP